jgi:hypothetical protein
LGCSTKRTFFLLIRYGENMALFEKLGIPFLNSLS